MLSKILVEISLLTWYYSTLLATRKPHKAPQKPPGLLSKHSLDQTRQFAKPECAPYYFNYI